MNIELPDYVTHAIADFRHHTISATSPYGRHAEPDKALGRLQDAIRAYGEDQYNRGNRDGMGLP